jgi:hypothetical protein
MSHHHERAEKTCLNCGTAPLVDRFCHHCGQENVEPKQTLWHLITHVFNDITHFDGKFFSTMKMLLKKPGYLSEAYLRGQRTAYLDPIRLYLFISAAFFVFAHYTTGDTFKMDRVSVIHDKGMIRQIDSMRIANKADNVEIISETITDEHNENRSIVIFNVYDKLRYGVKHYDSLVKSGAEPKSWFVQFRRRQLAAIYEAYEADPYNFFPELWGRFTSSVSKIFFISLPLFAFVLHLLNTRHRKQYYYVSHSIFALHFYSVAFIFLIPYIAISPWVLVYEFVWMVQSAILLGVFVYLLVAMKRFYRQGWIKTFFKFSILSFTTIIMILLIIAGIFLNSFMSMAAH